jgi:hypothetical protein
MYLYAFKGAKFLHGRGYFHINSTITNNNSNSTFNNANLWVSNLDLNTILYQERVQELLLIRLIIVYSMPIMLNIYRDAIDTGVYIGGILSEDVSTGENILDTRLYL